MAFTAIARFWILWGNMKDKYCLDNPETINHLIANIEAAIAEIEPHKI